MREPALVVWTVVNGVCLLQAVGFAARPWAPRVNEALGIVIAAAAIPATWALVEFVRTGGGWLDVAGPLAFDAFVIFMLVVDYILGIEWRHPRRAAIQVPYLLLFFGSVALMGLPMYSVDRRLWLATVASATALVVAMLYAMRRGVA